MKRLILLLLFFVTCSVASYGQITFSSLTEISDGSVDTSAQIVLVNPTSNIPVWRGSVGELLKAISRVGAVIATGSIIDGTITDADIASGADIGIEKLDTTSADGVVSKSRLSNALDDLGGGANLASPLYQLADGVDTVSLSSNEFAVHKISLISTDTTNLNVNGGVSGGRYILHLRNVSNDYVRFESNFLFPDSTDADVRQFSGDVMIYYHYDGTNYWAQEVVGVSATWPGGFPSYGYIYLSSTALSKDSIQLSWTQNYENVDSFTIQRGTDGVAFSDIATGITDSAYYDTSISANTLYYYRIKGNFTSTSRYSNRSRKGAFIGYDIPAESANGRIQGELDNVFLHQDSSWSVEMWMQLEDFPNNGDDRLFAFYDNDATSRQFNCVVENDSILSFQYRTGSSAKDIVNTRYVSGSSYDVRNTDVPYNRMIHMVVTHNGNGDFRTGSKVFFDGYEVPGYQRSDDLAGGSITGHLHFFSAWWPHMGGKTGPLRIYRDDLTATQVLDLYNQGIPKYDLSSYSGITSVNFDFSTDSLGVDTIYVNDVANGKQMLGRDFSTIEQYILDSEYDDVIWDQNYRSIPLDSFLTYDGNYSYYQQHNYDSPRFSGLFYGPNIWYDSTTQRTYFSAMAGPGVGSNQIAKIQFIDHRAKLLSNTAATKAIATAITDYHPKPGVISFQDTLVTIQENIHNSELYVRSLPFDLNGFSNDTDTLQSGVGDNAYFAIQKVGANLILVTRDQLNKLQVYKSSNAVDWSYVGKLTDDPDNRNYPINAWTSTQDTMFLGIGMYSESNGLFDTICIIKTVDPDAKVWTNTSGGFLRDITSTYITRAELLTNAFFRDTSSASIPPVFVGDGGGNVYSISPSTGDSLVIHTLNNSTGAWDYRSRISRDSTNLRDLPSQYGAVSIGVDSFDFFIIEKRDGKHKIVQYRTTDGFQTMSFIKEIGDSTKDYAQVQATNNYNETEYITVVASEIPIPESSSRFRPANILVYHYKKP
jgi:hypothetical protein